LCRIPAIRTRAPDSPEESRRRIPELSADAPYPGLHGLARERARAQRQRPQLLALSRLKGDYLHRRLVGLQMLAITHVLQEPQINRLGAVHDGELGGLGDDAAHLRRDAVRLAQE
jgi:hypothetical protein